jgi:hypothetical protein
MVTELISWEPKCRARIDGEKITPLAIYRNPGEGIELATIYYMGILSQSYLQLRK